jgi:hypothetical protein
MTPQFSIASSQQDLNLALNNWKLFKLLKYQGALKISSYSTKFTICDKNEVSPF